MMQKYPSKHTYVCHISTEARLSNHDILNKYMSDKCMTHFFKYSRRYQKPYFFICGEYVNDPQIDAKFKVAM